MVLEHVSNLHFSWKTVVFLSTLLFDTDSSSEVRIRDNLLQCGRYLRIKPFLSLGNHCALQLTATVKRSSTDFAISTSLIHSNVTVGCNEFAQTSVLELT